MSKKNMFVVLVVFVVVLLGGAIPRHVLAEDSYFFRIDTEIDVPAYYGTSGATVTWRCNGSGYGVVTDATPSESTNFLDGIIKVASTSAENNSSHAGCDAGEAITATVSFDGWVSRLWSDTVSNLGSNVTFTTRASMDYAIVVNGIADELGTTIVLDGSTASATYSGTVASQSYNGGKRYMAVSAANSGGTVKGGANNYVNVTSTALTVSATASQSVDFGTTTNSSINASGLPFAVKVTVNGTYRTGEQISNITGGTVTAGNGSGTSCTDSSGVYYCPVPITHTGVTATATNIHGLSLTNTCTYSARTSNATAQSTCTISATEPSATGGGGDSGSGTTTTSTPTPTPEVTPTPSPAVSGSPAPSPTPASSSTPSIPDATTTPAQVGLREGQIIGAASVGDPDIYIVNDWGYKRLFLNPVIFGFYGHLGGFAKVVGITSTTRDVLPTSGLFRNCETNTEAVWAVQTTGEDTGILHHVDMTGDAAVAQDPNFFKKVFCINTNEENWYSKNADAYTSLSQIPLYSR